MPSYPIHPFANALPMMSEDEYALLLASMKLNGWDPAHPAVLYEAKVLDGRNRLQAADELGIEPHVVDWTEVIEDPIEWVARENLARRSLTESQRAAVAVAFMPELMAQARVRKKKGQDEPDAQGGRSRTYASELTGASERLIQDAMKLDPIALSKVRNGEVTVTAALRTMTPERPPAEPAEPTAPALTLASEPSPLSVDDLVAAAGSLSTYDLGLVATKLRQKVRENKEPGADTDSWCTPPEIRDPVLEFFGTLDCDLATNEHGVMGAKVGYTVEDDCFKQDLSKHRTFWLNPWYSDPGPPMKLLADAIAKRIYDAEGLCLPKGDWSTEWWWDQVIERAAAICYWRKRVAYLHEGKRQTTATFPTALVYYGNNPERFEKKFVEYGDCRILRPESM